MIGMLLLPETPRFLIKKDNHDKAIKSLMFLRRLPADNPSLIEEYQEIKGNYEYELSLGKASYIECFKGTIGKRTLTGIGLQCLQQLVSPVPDFAGRVGILTVTGRRELHLLLRNLILLEPWRQQRPSQCLHPAGHHECGERGHDISRSLRH